MKTEAELYDFFETELVPLSEPKVNSSNKKTDKSDIIKIIVIISFILFVIFLFTGSFPVLLPVFFLFAFYRSYDDNDKRETEIENVENFKKKYMNVVFPKIVGFLFEDYEYIPNQRISNVVLNKSMLLEHHVSSVEGEGFMRFTVGGSDVMFSETKALNDNLNSIFKGVFLSASFNKNFTSKTFLFSKSITAFIKNTEKKIFSELEIVKLENNEFDHEFLILSTDQVEARYILTPNLMESILNYKHKMGANISISFVDNRLYCAIPDFSYHFDPYQYYSTDFSYVKDVYNQLKIYTDIVEDLHLNLRIWSKE
ncbi:MAG: DUF3137 domain-containing protein [Bacteroidota bacterium]